MRPRIEVTISTHTSDNVFGIKQIISQDINQIEKVENAKKLQNEPVETDL